MPGCAGEGAEVEGTGCVMSEARVAACVVGADATISGDVSPAKPVSKSECMTWLSCMQLCVLHASTHCLYRVNFPVRCCKVVASAS